MGKKKIKEKKSALQFVTAILFVFAVLSPDLHSDYQATLFFLSIIFFGIASYEIGFLSGKQKKKKKKK
jgi:hypothetical protein